MTYIFLSLVVFWLHFATLKGPNGFLAFLNLSVVTNLHCADCVCLYSTDLAGFLLKEMFGTRYGPVGSRFL